MKPHLDISIALIWRDGEILLSRRLSNAAHFAGTWEFPGGKVEEGETPAAAAVREAREEVGLTVEVTGARTPIEWEYEKRYVTLHPFDCRILGGKLEALEVSEVKFVTPSELRTEDFPPANAGLITSLRQEDHTA